MNTTKWTRTLLGLALVGVTACGGGETEEEVIEEAPVEAPAAPAMPEAAVLDATELQTNAAAHEGQTVRLNDMHVTSTVGTAGVWVELPNKNPFLVHTTTPPATGSMVDIVGTVTPITPAAIKCRH